MLQKISEVTRILQLSQYNGKLPISWQKQGNYPAISIYAQQAEIYTLIFFMSRYFPLPATWFDSLYSSVLSTYGAQHRCHETPSKLIICCEVGVLFSYVPDVLIVLPFEQACLYFVGMNNSNNRYCLGFCLRGGGGGLKADCSSVNVRSMKSHDRENLNRSKLLKDFIVPLSAIKYTTKK